MKKFLMMTTAILISTSAMAETLTKEQTTEIETIVKNYILNNPEVVIESLENMQKKMIEEQKKAAVKALNENRAKIESGDLFLGNKDGKTVIVKFFDYNCGYCKVMSEMLQKIMTENKDIKLVLKELPSLSKDSLEASRVVVAAHNQGKYAQMHNELIKSQSPATKEAALEIAKKLNLDIAKLEKDMNSDDINRIFATNREITRMLGSQAVPTIIIGDEIIVGSTGEDQIIEAIKKIKK